MIHVEYKKKDNFPHDREIILFDRDAFQSFGHEGLYEVNKRYNVLCPRVFVIECLAPNRATEVEKKGLLDRLKLIENPLVFIGDTNISPIINIPRGVEYPCILSSEQIARNCIVSKPITMERVTPEKLILHYRSRIKGFKAEIKALNDACRIFEKTLTPGQIDADVKKYFQEVHNRTLSKKEIRDIRRANEGTLLTQKLDCAARKALEDIEVKPLDQIIDEFKTFFFLKNQDPEKLKNLTQDGRRLTVENYPHLAYPIYLYYFICFITGARQYNTEHFDQSYARDIRYLHHLNFCDLFITNEKSTPHIVGSIPYPDITETPVMTSEALKRELV